MAKWTGWWEQRGYGRQMMHDLQIDVAADGSITGGGQDCVGPFEFDGRFKADGSVSLIKQYVGRHHVHYEGNNSGEGIFGQWHISHYWMGKFALSPVADSEAGYNEIHEFLPIG